MKTIQTILVTVLVGTLFSFYLSSCEKEKEVEVFITEICGCMEATAVNYNADANCDDGSCILSSQLDDTLRTYYSSESYAADNTNTPRLDKSHSSVRWETDYHDYGVALLTGRFGLFDAEITFKETDPSLFHVEGWVQLSTQSTTEPGRDNPGNCGPRYHGIEWISHDTIVGGDTITIYDGPVLSTDFAYLEADGAEYYFMTTKRGFATSYKSTGTLEYQGATSDVDIFFNFNGLDFPGDRTGFSGYYVFNCITDHGVTSTSAADQVTVRFNVLYRDL